MATVAEWNAAHPRHPRGPDGRFIRAGMDIAPRLARRPRPARRSPPRRRGGRQAGQRRGERLANTQVRPRGAATQRTPAPAARPPAEPVDLARLSDDELMSRFERLMGEVPPDAGELTRVNDELIRRERAQQAAQQATPEPAGGVDWDVPDTPEQRRIDELVARGWDYRDAWAEVHGVAQDVLAEQERLALVDVDRRPGETRRQAVRRAYGELVHVQFLEAEAATRGHLLNPQGRARGIDPVSLFSGPAARARRWASEDLLRWWEQNPRVTFQEFQQQVTGRGDRNRLATSRLAGSNRDFGV